MNRNWHRWTSPVVEWSTDVALPVLADRPESEPDRGDLGPRWAVMIGLREGVYSRAKL